MKLKFILLGLYWGTILATISTGYGPHPAFDWNYGDTFYAIFLLGTLVLSGYLIKD